MLPNHYEVLALPVPTSEGQRPTQQDIKLAYRRALLQHHPDKTTNKALSEAHPLKHTIDGITVAYKTLSNPESRSEYDRSIHLQHLATKKRHDTTKGYIGLETADLDDLHYDETKAVWFRACRCGNKRGYLVTERELEKEIHNGEVIVGCGGCSLSLKVMFQEGEGG
ncbi:Diphthamide biosynthesis protein 4 [Varicellaria rhodocarpa]|nr:Diphthamide biosynthesis protein 4 [Varicellaria rhodocarpa]